MVWALIIIFVLFVYVVMDGFDLGIGLFFAMFKVGYERDTAMNSIAPLWDGNETRLMLGITSLAFVRRLKSGGELPPFC